MKKLFAALISSLFALVLFTSATTQVHAGTDLTVNCPAIGTCTINPTNTPLFNEAGWMPGSTVTQKVTVTNSSSQNGFTGIQAANYTDTNSLGQVINIQIHQGSPAGTLLYAAPDLITFKNDGFFTIGPINAGQTIDYYFTATMATSAGNQYQGSQVKFDLIAGLEITPIAPPSGGGGGTSGGGGGGSVAGTTTVAPPPVCTDTAPTSAPTVRIVSQGTNTVTLGWTSVSPVTHYGLFFTRVSDGAQYGATNIGNVTTYTITNLSGGASYSFQVFGVNGCAPGPRSNTVTSGNIAGPFIAGRPLGNGSQVLGVSTEVSPTPSPSPSASPSPSPTTDPNAGKVLGATTCVNWKQYIPWILLVLQFILVLLAQIFYRNDESWAKHIWAVVFTILSIVLFYLFKVCPCSGTWVWLGWLCPWYWLVSIILTLLVRGFAYSFIDNDEPERKRDEKKSEEV